MRRLVSQANRAASASFPRRPVMLLSITLLAILATSRSASACGLLPSVLPLNEVVYGSTCEISDVEPCTSTVYPSPIATSRFTLDEPSRLSGVLMGGNGYDPVIYLSGSNCEQGDCGFDLEPGDYCVTITASESSAIGSCGCFSLNLDVEPDRIMQYGFE